MGGFVLGVKVAGLEQQTPEILAALGVGEASGMEKLGLRGEQLVKEHTPVGATGFLSGGVFHELHSPAPNLAELVSVHPPADVYSMAVETGARPHFPPSSALVLWVQRKLHVSDEKKALQIAFLIARKISQRGTQGAHMFEIAFNQLQTEATPIMERELAVALTAAGYTAGGRAI